MKCKGCDIELKLSNIMLYETLYRVYELIRYKDGIHKQEMVPGVKKEYHCKVCGKRLTLEEFEDIKEMEETKK